MSITNTIDFAKLDDFILDPFNPRLRQDSSEPPMTQDAIMELMEDMTLDELAISILNKGFWPQEALLAVRETDVEPDRMIVVEGNRRLAALMKLRATYEGRVRERKWLQIIEDRPMPDELFTQIPYLFADSRDELESYLGFRHVTGVKQWDPGQKARFISNMIDGGQSYEEVRSAIGSRTDTVRRNYIAYKILVQLDDLDQAAADRVRKKFSVFFLSLRESGVRMYLDVELQAEPDHELRPIKPEREDSLKRVIRWMFGSEDHPPLFTDSRDVGDFAQILRSPEGRDYLESTDEPDFETAQRRAGVTDDQVREYLSMASANLENALAIVHLMEEPATVTRYVERMAQGIMALTDRFPQTKNKMKSQLCQEPLPISENA